MGCLSLVSLADPAGRPGSLSPAARLNPTAPYIPPARNLRAKKRYARLCPDTTGNFDRNVLLRADHAAGDLVAFDRVEQGFKVAFAEAFIALALDELEEDRAEERVGEDLE